MIKDGPSLTARILRSTQINCRLQTLPPPPFFTPLLFCFHSPFLNTSHYSFPRGVKITFPLLFATISHQLPVLTHFFFQLFLSFCDFSVPPISFSFLWEGGMSSTAAYRQFLQDLEEKRGRCPLQPCHLSFTIS